MAEDGFFNGDMGDEIVVVGTQAGGGCGVLKSPLLATYSPPEEGVSLQLFLIYLMYYEWWLN